MHEIVATRGMPPEFVNMFQGPVRLGPETGVSRLVRGESFVHIADASDDEGYRLGNPVRRALVDIAGARSYLAVPISRDGVMLGSFTIYRREVRPFSGELIALLQSFAAQAGIAIENARLFNETQEALERQTATADILRVIASSPSDVKPVFEAIAARAKSLIGGFSSTVFRFIDGVAHLEAFTPTSPEADDILRSTFPRPAKDFAPFRMTQAGEVMQIPDTEALTDEILDISRARGFRSMVFAPLMNKGVSIGFIAVTRIQPGDFTDHHVQLLRTFADQAVIAIQNVRLFDEVEAKTHDLEESLQQQTATADVLKVISRSAFDLQAVLDTLVKSAAQLCEADMAAITRRIGDVYYRAGTYGFPQAFAEYIKQIPVTPERRTITGRTLLEGRVVHVEDVLADPDYDFEGQELSGNPHSFLGVPLLREGTPIGALTLTRYEIRPFTQKQIELIATFADQAVIAIENVRLFDEIQARTIDLSEALEQQTATAEVLGVISSSAGDLAPVFDAMLGKAMHLCSADFGVLNTYDGKAFHTAATYALPPAYDEFRRKQPMEYGPGTALVRLLQGEPVVEITDLVESEAYRSGEPNRRALVDIGGARCLLAVPLLKDERVVGNVMIFRQEKGRFSEKQILLLQQFAAQAVIAIENTRLLRELRQRTDDLTEALTYQTGSSDILKVIASSPTNVLPVLQAIVASVCELCGAYDAVVRLKRGQALEFSAHHGPIPITSQSLPVDRNSTAGLAVIEGNSVHVHDLLTKEGDAFPEAQHRARQFGHRTILSVPMMRKGQSIGAIVLRRTEVDPFTDKQVALVRTFADQAVIAIDNAQLFQEVQVRTSELSKSLEDLRAAQDRLIQTEKLASLGQLTAGIAHEIKNPLNFVNNFSALSSDLTDELNEVLKQERLTDNGRQEVNELTALLKDNLGKVVQHGKRADSIVKNMLMHSREGLGEHRLADINAIVEESLNLAYHGARAEKPGFNITLERDLDPTVNDIELYPQEITRALINLISNGFYAATKRAGEAGSDIEPVLKAATKNVGDGVEIRIRDNGTGIPSDIKEKIFNPFFTTKPAGDGTGLGLSMSHDIIVKQHGGTIDVDTAPGAFTEFRIVLPRTGAFHIKPGERT